MSMTDTIKGVVLAGGLGTRLAPLTKVTNKHLLGVFDRPMVYYPIETLVKSGVTDILLVTGQHSAGDFMKLIGNGHSLGLKRIYYAMQEGEGGIPDALKLAEEFVGNSNFAVILGDNIFEDTFDLKDLIHGFDERDATIFLKEVTNPERFGVVDLDENNQIISITEKPSEPKSKLAVTGLYVYNSHVFNVIKELKPSTRGELEITDVNNWYLNRRYGQYDTDCYCSDWKHGHYVGSVSSLGYEMVNGIWTDAGTFDSLYYANTLMAKKAHAAKYNKNFEKVMSIVG